MAKRKHEKNESSPEIGQLLPIEWHSPEGLQTRFVNNMIVQKSEKEWFISFYEIVPPLVLGSEDQKQKIPSELQAVKAECVSRIVVTEEFIEKMVNTLQRMLPKQDSERQSNAAIAG